jgi:hypothetical protein
MVKEYQKENCFLSTLPDSQEREFITALFFIAPDNQFCKVSLFYPLRSLKDLAGPGKK